MISYNNYFESSDFENKELTEIPDEIIEYSSKIIEDELKEMKIFKKKYETNIKMILLSDVYTYPPEVNQIFKYNQG